MTGIISALMKGEPIPVAVVTDQQEIEQEADRESEVEITTGGEPIRQRQRKLMEMFGED